jgi:hypothetical protein
MVMTMMMMMIIIIIIITTTTINLETNNDAIGKSFFNVSVIQF